MRKASKSRRPAFVPKSCTMTAETRRLTHYAVRFADPLTKVVLSKAKMMRLVKYIQTPPSASFYDTWNVLQHPNLYFSAIQRMMWFFDASSHLYERVCPSVHPSVCRSIRRSVRWSVHPLVGYCLQDACNLLRLALFLTLST